MSGPRLRIFRDSLRYQLDKHVGTMPDVIWLASYPRSGNTFFRAVLKFAFDIPSFDIYHLRRPFRGGDVSEELGLTDGALSRNPATGRRVYVLKTHQSAPKDENPGIYLIRDGRDALVSHAHHRLGGRELRLPPEQQTRERFLEALRYLLDKNSYGGWSGNVEAWMRKETTHLVRFEDLIQTPLEAVGGALTSAGYVLPEVQAASLPTFEQLHTKHPSFFRKGRVGAWREEMPDDIHRLFWERHGETMTRFGYTDGMP